MEEGFGRLFVTQVGGERAVRTELHHRALHASGLGGLKRDRITEIDELGAAEDLGGLRGRLALGDAEHAVRLRALFAPHGDLLLADERRAGAV